MDIQLVNHNKKMTDTIDNRGEFVKAGYLIKSPPLSRAPVAQWHRRWFLLMDSALVFPMAKRYVRLDYYQSEADAKRLADPKGSINLKSCLSVVALTEPLKNFKFVFDVCTTDRVYHLAADTEEDRTEWVNTLKTLLFTSQTEGNSSNQLRSPYESPEVTRRLQGSPRMPRPQSYTGSIPIGSPKVHLRPLPPVPDSGSSSVPSSPVDRKNHPVSDRPLPALPLHSQRVHINPIGLQKSSGTPRKKIPPPVKPAPYRKNNSDQSAPTVSTKTHHLTNPPPVLSRSASLSPPFPVSAEDYEKVVMKSSQPSSHDDNYSLATSGAANDDYSILEATVIHGYDPTNQDYSHLQPVMNDSPPPPIRNSSLAHHPSSKLHPPARTSSPSSIADYVNCPNASIEEDYSHLHY